MNMSAPIPRSRISLSKSDFIKSSRCIVPSRALAFLIGGRNPRGRSLAPYCFDLLCFLNFSAVGRTRCLMRSCSARARISVSEMSSSVGTRRRNSSASSSQRWCSSRAGGRFDHASGGSVSLSITGEGLGGSLDRNIRHACRQMRALC